MIANLRFTATSLLLSSCAMIAFASDMNATAVGKKDPVIISFSTVGDSRQDPKEFDATVGPLSAQDKIWLQNTKAFSRILRDIESQKSKLLFSMAT